VSLTNDMSLANAAVPNIEPLPTNDISSEFNFDEFLNKSNNKSPKDVIEMDDSLLPPLDWKDAPLLPPYTGDQLP
jgi:hypothetical protein